LLIFLRITCTSNTADIAAVHPIRSYRTRTAPSPPCTILEAARACIASPDKFIPVTLGKTHRKAVLIDAVAAYANPTKELLREAQDVFGEDAEVASVISIGAGKSDAKMTFKDGNEVGISNALRRGTAMSEQVHEDLEGRLHETGIYFRFNVEKPLDEKPDIILAHTSSYLREKATSIRVDEATKSFYRRPKGVKMRDISTYEFMACYLDSPTSRFGDAD
jgi:hypothetical protein